MNERTKIAKLRVAEPLLIRALGLPEDTKIRAIEFGDYVGELRLIIEQGHLQELAPGAAIPVVSAEFSRDQYGLVRFEGWK